MPKTREQIIADMRDLAGELRAGQADGDVTVPTQPSLMEAAADPARAAEYAAAVSKNEADRFLDQRAYNTVVDAIGSRLSRAEAAIMFEKMAASPAAVTMFEKTYHDDPGTRAMRANATLPALADFYRTNPQGFNRLLGMSANDPDLNPIIAKINASRPLTVAELNTLAAQNTPAAPRAAAAAPAAPKPAARDSDAADLAQPAARSAAPAAPAPVAPVAAVAAVGRESGRLGIAEDAQLTQAQAQSAITRAEQEMRALEAEVAKIVGPEAAAAFAKTMTADTLATAMLDPRYAKERSDFLMELEANKELAITDMAKRPAAYYDALTSGSARFDIQDRLIVATGVFNMLPKPDTIEDPRIRQGVENLMTTEAGRAALLHAVNKGSDLDVSAGQTIFQRNMTLMQDMLAGKSDQMGNLTAEQRDIILRDFAEAPHKYAQNLGSQNFVEDVKRVATAEIAGHQMGWNFDGVGSYFSGMLAEFGNMFKDLLGSFKDMFGDLLGGFGLNLDGVASKAAPADVATQHNAMNGKPLGNELDEAERKRQAALGAAPGVTPTAAPRVAPELDPNMVPAG